MELEIQSFGPCDENLVVEILCIPGTYIVSVGGQSVTVTNSTPVPLALVSATFENFDFEPGVTYTISVYPENNPECLTTIEFSNLGCNPEFVVACDGKGTKMITYTGGCPSLLYLEITSGPGTLDGAVISSADDTTVFSVVTSNGCTIAGLTTADAVDVTPCGKNYQTCTYFTDFGNTISSGTCGNIVISSFIYDGVELITTPVPLGPPNLITIGAEDYNTAFADAINSIGSPYFTAEYPTEALILSAQAVGPSVVLRNNIVRFKRPNCINFTIVAQNLGIVGPNPPAQTYTWTETTYTPSLGMPTLYAQAAALDCVTSVEC
jgi:hypothetical protein